MIDPAAYEYVRLESDGGVLLATLNRPEVINALNRAMHDEVLRLLRALKNDDDTRVLVLTGAGRGFCSGADLSERASQPGPRVDALLRQRELVQGMIDLEQPIVSAVHGPAVGSGLALALMADISVVAEDARLVDANVNLGVVSADHAVLTWPLLCGMAKAKDLLLTGNELSGAEAERIGVASRAVPGDQVLQTARDIAHGIAEKPSAGVRGTKQALNGWLRMATPFNDTAIAYAMSSMLNQRES